MNKSESKYFNTALLMNEALNALLETKDLEYITVKEICEKAGVNRSTFYLHYETIADLADETLETVIKRFSSYFEQSKDGIVSKISSCELSELVFITKDYLRPYLQFIYDNRNIYRAAFRNPNGMQINKQYKLLKIHVLEPILQRFEVPDMFRKYYISYYIEGIAAIIKEWLNTDCSDSIDSIITVIEECIRPLDWAEGKRYRE